MRYWDKGEELNKGKFVVEQLLGSGGFGVTYKVKHTRNNKLFALKTLNHQVQNRPDFEQLQVKFINEAIALASCRHPHIVRVYPQRFQEGELWCMVMEYVEGEDLACHINPKHKCYTKFSEQEAVEIITKVGNALTHVHATGLLHRDIKPENILLRNSDLSPVLIDFGLAREYTPGTIRSMTNARTERYAPIEQYQRNGNFGAWTDVYALAATLYALLTERPPIPSEIRKEVQPDVLIPPKQFNPELTDRVNEAILKAMEIEPGDRPDSIKVWLELLKSPIAKIKPPQARIFNRELVNISRYASKQYREKKEKNTKSPYLKVFEFEILKFKKEIDGYGFSDFGDGEKIKHTKINYVLSRDRGQAKYFTEYLSNRIALEMIEIPGGTFKMGRDVNTNFSLFLDGNKSKSPKHQVKVPNFYMGKFEVTQAQWRLIATLPQVERELKPNPSTFKGDNLPVESVSWYDAVEFCKRLSKATYKEYRLPSEAEWEYACRAGTNTSFHFGDIITTDLANYKYNNSCTKGKYRKTTTPVGNFPPNAFGLYDMHGNVWEWCEDDWHDNYQGAPNNGSAWVERYNIENVLRGGSWNDYASLCDSDFRFKYFPGNFNFNIGFRVVCIASRTI